MAERYKTGQNSPHNASYDFDGYLDGSSTPAPTAEERSITLERNEKFPPINSSDKGCWWALNRKL